jgi:hypothetical protein
MIIIAIKNIIGLIGLIFANNQQFKLGIFRNTRGLWPPESLI